MSQDINSRIKALQKELEKLEEEKKALESLSDEQKLALKLHDIFCRHDHVEGCSWFYEIESGIHKWERSEHLEWLRKAGIISNECKKLNIHENDAIKIAKLLGK